MEDEYKSMIFQPVDTEAKQDSGYGASVIQGISGANADSPGLGYSPISQELKSLAYSEITPRIEEWAGVELEPSWGYGIRSYGRGSILHVHRDRVDTHVVSCIVHVDDQSDKPWALDFIDHEGEHHGVTFERGTMLFYESLCPHARIIPFAGEYYRNMYFHWRPRDWDPSPYKSMRCKFATIEEAQSDVRRWALVRSVSADWREWLLLNRDRGCAYEGMIERSEKRGFSRLATEAVLGLSPEEAADLRLPLPPSTVSVRPVIPSAPDSSAPNWLRWFEAPLTRPDHKPRAWRLDTSLAQVYELPAFLTPEECEELRGAIDQKLIPSTVTRGDKSYRTSRTCHLRGADADLAKRLDQRLVELFGVEPGYSEPLQGQRYDAGQYFKEHTDCFAPGTEEYAKHTNPGGQRTWTVMIYLNTVPGGGQTCFRRLGRCFTPVQGLALAWNNLMADGTPNPFTLHEAMPVEEGSKWVITKWFRAQTGRNG
ncbi:MAG: 2OG-Fe(II) oxygenase [Cyanobacteriota bacterium]|nr:2OG-Fe(II) oxygenase [Cyanobacteriota bacterium]